MEKNMIFRMLLVLCAAAGLTACRLSRSLAAETELPVPPLPGSLPATREADAAGLPATATVTVQAPMLDFRDTPVTRAGIPAQVDVQSMLLRSGPGSLYEVVSSYPQGSTVTAVGRATGDEWVKVETEDNRVGWMLVTFLALDGDVAELQLETVKDSHTIYGSILDRDGLPVDDINLAVYRYQGDQDERSDACSGDDGRYTAYLPDSLQGTWAVEIVGYGCSSNIMNGDDCTFAGHFEPDRPITFDLPYNGPFDFTYVMP